MHGLTLDMFEYPLVSFSSLHIQTNSCWGSQTLGCSIPPCVTSPQRPITEICWIRWRQITWRRRFCSTRLEQDNPVICLHSAWVDPEVPLHSRFSRLLLRYYGNLRSARLDTLSIQPLREACGRTSSKGNDLTSPFLHLCLT